MKEENSPFERLLLRLAYGRVVILFLFHAVVFAAAYAFSYLVRFEFAIAPDFLSTFKSSLIIVVSIQLLAGVVFGFYRGWWRYVGMGDVVRLGVGLSVATGVLFLLWYGGRDIGIEDRFIRSPRGVLLIDWAFSLLALFGTRVVIRLGRDRFRPQQVAEGQVKRVLVIGAGDAGETLAREIEHRPQLAMKVVGFVDDQRAKWGAQIRGIKVMGPISRIGSIADSFDADEALLAIPSASGKRLREIVGHLLKADLPFKTIPGFEHLVTGRVHVSQLRPVNIEDLMRRKKIELPGDPVRHLFRGKRVLVTGAGGTIGSELCSQIAQFEPERLALVERSEFALYEARKRLKNQLGAAESVEITSNLVDICDGDAVEALIAREQPQIVLHAAAHKHVPLGEENPAEYLRNNTIATRRLGDICTRAAVERFVFISTDKAINPTSVMGATKRAAEILLLDLGRNDGMKITIVRFGNVIGSSGSVIPLFMEQIAAGGPVTVTHPDVTRYFIRTSEAISLVLQAATLGTDRQIFMLDMGEPVKIADLARDLIRLSNHTEEEIPLVFTGLRAGEKLFEEVSVDDESVVSTPHPQIVITRAVQPERAAIERWLHRAHGHLVEAREALAELVPEYGAPAPETRSDARRDERVALAGLASPI